MVHTIMEREREGKDELGLMINAEEEGEENQISKRGKKTNKRNSEL